MTADPTITGRAHSVRTRRTEWVAAPGAGPARPGGDAGCPLGSTGEDRRSPPGTGNRSPASARARPPHRGFSRRGPIRGRTRSGSVPYRSPSLEDHPVKEAVEIGRNPAAEPGLPDLMADVAQGDQEAFAAVYDVVAGPVLGIVRRVLRDLAQSEEVAQEVLVEVWRTAARYRPERGSVMNWVLTLAHQRAVDRVRSAEASAAREHKAALLDRTPEFDEVTEQVEARLEREQVRRCLRTLTELQRQSVTLAYYRGLTYREVAELLTLPLGTVKTRLRDGLIRLRDCLGVTA